MFCGKIKRYAFGIAINMNINTNLNVANVSEQIPEGGDRHPLVDSGSIRDKTTSLVAATLKEDSETIKSKIKDYLSANLPDSETRIAAPMDANCKVAVVVPAYGERGYILRGIYSLAQQKGVDINEYELIIVVNNPPSMPNQEFHETDEDYLRKTELYQKALGDNDATIQLIQKIQGADVDVETAPEEDEMIKKIRDSGLKVHFIDKASPNKTLPLGEANVGGARNRGVAEAVERFYLQSRDGIIAQSDADVRFDEGYIRALIDAFQDPELVGLAGQVEFDQDTNDDSSLAKMLSSHQNLKNMYADLMNIMLKKEFGEEVVEQDKKLTDFYVHFAGSNMASRAFTAALAGGVPKLAGGEDPAFGQRISKLGKVAKVKTVITHPADRFSARTDVNCGHGQQRIKDAVALSTGEMRLFKPIERVRAEKNILKSFGAAFMSGNISMESLRSILTVNNRIILTEEELHELGESLANIAALSQAESSPNLVLLRLKNRVMEELIKEFPDVTIQEACKEFEKILSSKGDISAYEYQWKDSIIDVKRFELVVRLLSDYSGPVPSTKEEFLAKIKATQPEKYAELDDHTPSWANSIFMGEVFDAISTGKSEGESDQDLAAKVADKFPAMMMLIDSENTEAIMKLWAMRNTALLA